MIIPIHFILTELNLNNLLSFIEDYSFQHLFSMEKLYIDFNVMQKLGENSFWGLNRLKILSSSFEKVTRKKMNGILNGF